MLACLNQTLPFGYKLEGGSDSGSKQYLQWVFLSHRKKKIKGKEEELSNTKIIKKEQNVSKKSKVKEEKVKPNSRAGKNQKNKRKEKGKLGGRG